MKPIVYTKGDATDPEGGGPKIIAHVCNDMGKWGAGFVLAISKRWMEPEEHYKNWYKSRWDQAGGLFELGAAQFVKVQTGLYVANMIAQQGINRSKKGTPPIRYEALAEALDAVRIFAQLKRGSVHMPRIGCGLAGGDWTIVEPIIIDKLSSNNIQATVYDLLPS